MNLSSPYSPDRSLPRAIGVLTGILLISAGGVYIISFLPVGTGGDGRNIAGASGPPPAPPGYAAEDARSRGGSSPIAGGGLTAWTGLDRPSAPTEQFAPVPQGSYDIDPDFSHADLGAPSAPSGGEASGGVDIADAGSPGSGPTGGAPGAGPVPSTPDLSGTSSGGAAVGGDAPQWQSGAQALASRSRALSGALGRIDRQGSREASRSRSETAEEGSSGEAATASGTGASSTSSPGAPSDPDQVPLGGAEWLAAAGAAYALNRLRGKDGGEEESGDDA
ncbi:MAG: hypothetical protein BRD41_04820 [Bacteroidetes bacterium QS_1_63_11]|nr:MAG: hypothetical protein BRD41_04820 [Bacteroidetes bacterium QS_1_63_11]